MVLAGFLALAALSTPCAPASRPWLSEVYYDAPGDDTGREFVELANPGAAPVPLAGLRLEAGDGSGPGRWTLRWTAGAADTIAAGGRFVIGGAAVLPAPNAVAALDLQNGPDAVRLVWPDGAAEVLGYGTHEFAEYACGAPAPDAPSGQSLARTPDDAASGSNTADFRPAVPSPGAPNVPARNAALAPGSLRLRPERPAPGESLWVEGGLRNTGREAFAPGSVAIALEAAREDGRREPLATRAFGALLVPGDSAGFTLAALAPAPGRARLVVRLAAAGDASAADDADSLPARFGPCPLALREIQFQPEGGEGEWIELRNVARAAVDLGAFVVSDRAGTTGAAGAGVLEPDSLAVLAQDPAALRARFPALDSARVLAARPWPSLNNRDDEQGIADVIALAETDGTPCERLGYSAAGLPPGVPLEWRDGGWWPARAAGGSPLAPPRAFEPPRARFALAPARLGPGARLVRCRWSLPWPRVRIRIEVLDLAGRRVPGGVPEFLAPGAGEREVALAELTPGLYAVVLRARPDGGSEEIAELLPLRVTGTVR